jgi:hypothetical protein
MDDSELQAGRQVTWKRRLVVAIALIGGPITVNGQQADPSSAFIQRVQSALQSPQPSVTGQVPLSWVPNKPEGWRVGVFTFLTPDAQGQFVRIRVPVGALASRAVRSVAAAQHRRSESAAHGEVAGALAAFLHAEAK